MAICNCGNEASYHCTSCIPNTNLCLNCIPLHLSKNSDDCIKPIKSRQPGVNICESCGTEKATKLGIFDTCVRKLCKVCKSNADLCVDLKWADFVNKPSDLEVLSYRRAAVIKLHRELDQSLSSLTVLTNFEIYKSDLSKLLDSIYTEKIKEITSLTSRHDSWVSKIKKEVTEQSYKKEIDTNTEGGRLLESVLTNSPLDFSQAIPLITYPDIKDFHSFLLSFFSNIKLAGNPNEKAVFLFSPGKNTIIKVNVETKKKNEFLFDRNWSFEASWVQLTSGELFFCGGNGRDNSEVLSVNLNTRTIKNLQPFTGRSGHTMIQVNSEVYVFGGNKGNCTEKYVLGEDKWFGLSALPNKILRATSCLTKDGVVVTGAESDKLYLYSLEKDTYLTIEFPLSGYLVKNKILFTHEDFIYCLVGDRVIVARWGQNDVTEYVIPDRDWWSYSAPVVCGKNAYFIKYFVRNLWSLNLETFKLSETALNSIS